LLTFAITPIYTYTNTYIGFCKLYIHISNSDFIIKPNIQKTLQYLQGLLYVRYIIFIYLFYLLIYKINIII